MGNFIQGAIAHPKTTIFGFAGAVLTLVAGGLDWQHALIAALIAGGGAAAADHSAQ